MQTFLKRLGKRIAVIGTQWGDEGKGKIVDAISSNFQYICRSAGGANAGHTIYTNGKKHVFHLLPSGLLHPKTIGIIGNGCVLEVEEFLKEVNELTSQGLELEGRIRISLRTHLLFDYHKKIDAELENRKGKNKIGTTCRGIGPCYTDKIMRIGIRAEDLLDKDLLWEKLERNVNHHNQTLNLNLNAQEEFDKIISLKDQIKPFLGDTTHLFKQAIKEENTILFEGAQAHHLDIDHGTYPFVTSSNVGAGGICTGLGIPPKAVDAVIGIAKAYTTRVGEGPFPSELSGKEGDELREAGGEFGATTGRPRRCGWFDAVVVRHSVFANGIDTLNLTKLDVLSGLPEIKIATKYILDGKEIHKVPTTRKANQKLEIEYITLPGWEEDISGLKNFHDLPQNAQNYIKKIEELTECEVGVIGVGMDREDLIFR